MNIKVKNILISIPSIIFFALWAGIIILNIFYSSANYAAKKSFAFSNAVLLIFGLVISFCILYICSFTEDKLKRININMLSIILFALQVFIFYHIQFMTNSWDAGTICNAAHMISRGMEETSDWYSFYYSTYPNNQLITLLYAFILKAGITDGFFPLVVLQCFLCSLSGKLIFDCIEILTNRRMYALFGWMLFLILLGLSGWNVVPYSDMTGLIFPIAIFRIYLSTRNGEKVFLKWLLIVLLSYAGYKIKPTVIVSLIAILMAEFIEVCFACDRIGLKTILRKIIKYSCISLASIFICSNILSIGFKSTGIKIDSERYIGALHFVMMGLNSHNNGCYFQDDYELSVGISTRSERTEVQINLIKQRLKNYGAVGLMKHLAKKTLTNMNDGTFAWECEGGFYDVIYEDKDEVISPFLKSIYYSWGSWYPFFSSVEQATWLIVLLLSGGIIFARKSKYEFMIILSLVGIVVFHLLFEARARYLIVYVPYFIIAAVVGISKLLAIIRKEL